MQRTIAKLCGTRGAFESNGRRYFAPHHMLGDADTAHIKRTSSYDSNPMAKLTDSILAAHNYSISRGAQLTDLACAESPRFCDRRVGDAVRRTRNHQKDPAIMLWIRMAPMQP
jgi:hypothetical protein